MKRFRLRSRTLRHSHQLVGQQITLPCQSQQEIHDLLHPQGLKALRITGRPGARHCDITGTPAALALLDRETVAALQTAPYQASGMIGTSRPTQQHHARPNTVGFVVPNKPPCIGSESTATLPSGAIGISRPTTRPIQKPRNATAPKPRQATNFGTRLATLILPFLWLWSAITARNATRRPKGYKKMNKMIKNAAVGTLTALASAVPAQGAITSFDPTQSNLVTNPVVGISQTSDDYMLTSSSGTFSLDKAFNTDFAENFSFTNDTTMQDAASNGDNSTYHLGVSDGIYKIDNATGFVQNIGAFSNLSAGAGSFGLGAVDNSIYSFASNGRNEAVMTQFSADTGANLGTTNFGDLSTYGTLTGAEVYKTDAGNIGFLLTAKDQVGSDKNYVLDFNTDGSFTGNGLSIVGADLEDITYNSGALGLGFNDSGLGEIQRGSYVGTAAPEPSSAAGLAGLAALGYVVSRRPNRKE